MSSSSPRKNLDQGISASRAGGAQKRPPATSKASTPVKKQRANPRPSPSVGSASRRSGDDSATDTGSVASKVRRRVREAGGEEETKWAQSERLLLDRTLRLHTLSPLHLSSLPASAQEVSRPLFQLLRTELRNYINLRLSDGFGFLESGGTTIDARDADSGDLRPPERRRRADADRVGRVRIGFIDDAEFNTALQQKATARAWAIEIELGKPAEESESNRLGALRSKAAQEVTPAELCHIVFVPASKGHGGHSRTSHSYPLVATKAPSSSAAGADPLMAAAENVAPVVLGHALDWIQKRFDCRISAATSAASLASRLTGPRLEALAELIVRETRAATDALSADQKAADAAVKPVELVLSFPTKVKGAEPGETLPGPAPDLGSLTLTVPWEICMNLLDGLNLDEPLLPALNHYLAVHTSIPLDALELTRIGVAGINVGSGRIKIARLPVRADDAGEKSLHKRAQRANDRRRAGSVFAFLRQVVEGDVDESS
ncbi:hypothetical protein PANT_22c00105 [Moesziomyces antarcticus T-34]|uniref:Uncharacterized protein n=1 Tax=Pseudozyma antarctica (strain T-34) TaxID=1151754 RepID=M9M6V4_PSEA3|nr:hypothetical protein PANT_22c00105 [Moesziomyces antarcticus T-34]